MEATPKVASDIKENLIDAFSFLSYLSSLDGSLIL